METEFEKIIRKTGMKPSQCKCNECKSQCAAPCKGTPEDMMKIIGAGFSDRVMAIKFDGQLIITPLYDSSKKVCTFFNNGLCDLHDSGLKPTEGKLSHHSTLKLDYKKSITKHVLDTWKALTDEEINSLIDKHILKKQTA